MRRNRLRTVVVLAAMAVAATLPSLSAPAAVADSGPGWNSGVFIPGQKPSDYRDFGSWRGRSLGVAGLWTGLGDWDAMLDLGWLSRDWKDVPVTKVVGVPMLPENDSSATMAGCARGDYDATWKAFAQGLKDGGLADDTVLRLGWEFNGNWSKWSAADPDRFVQCWRHVYTAAESVAPGLRWDWNVNRGISAGLLDPTRAYPGDGYVDYVGVDSYDQWPSAVDEATWQVQLNGPQGLNDWLRFARVHGKGFSVPEWGVYPGPGGSGGGDNAFYVQKMHDFFAANAGSLAFESYFNEHAAYYAGSIHGPEQNPRASATYRSLF